MQVASRRVILPKHKVPTTWNLADKSSFIDLSGGNLSTTGLASLVDGNVRANVGATTGKKYFEVTVNVKAGNVAVGIAAGNATLNTYIGSDNNSISFFSTNPVLLNNATILTFSSYSVANVVCVAADLDANKIWFRIDGGNWNNDIIGNQNPVGAVGGLSFAVLTGFRYPAINHNTTSDKMTANFGASAYAQTPPVGFGNW